MRLIAWNANYNARRRTLEETAALLAPLHADILVISETAPPCRGNPLHAHWTGATPGLAVIARHGLELEPHPANEGAPPLMAGYTVHGDLEFSLLALWPVQIDGGPNYHRVLMAAINRYAALLTTERTIMAGDGIPWFGERLSRADRRVPRTGDRWHIPPRRERLKRVPSRLLLRAAFPG